MYSLEEMKADGFTRRMANAIVSRMEEEKRCGWYDADYLEWAHSKGFLAESACAFELNESNIASYLSDYDYARLWPLNSWQRIWINDKLTLRYALEGTEWEKLLPEYYYYITNRGAEAIPGLGLEDGIEALAGCLEKRGELASKPCNGQRTLGFHRLSMEEGKPAIDGAKVGLAGLKAFVASNQNYIITEYLRPEESLAAIHPLIHTLRVVVGRLGERFEILAAYLRFGQTLTGSNYSGSGKEASNYTVAVDVDSGAYGNGKLIYFSRKPETSISHPTTGVAAEGVLPYWDEVRRCSIGVAESLKFLDYLGFDFGITPEGPRMMEINSHSGVKYLQSMAPVYKDPRLSEFFERKLIELETMGDAEKERRWAIAH